MKNHVRQLAFQGIWPETSMRIKDLIPKSLPPYPDLDLE
jgi:hypothetical protein